MASKKQPRNQAKKQTQKQATDQLTRVNKIEAFPVKQKVVENPAPS
jgi:hypothetical protein